MRSIRNLDPRAQLRRVRELADDVRAARQQSAGLHGVLSDAAGVARETTDQIAALRAELAHATRVRTVEAARVSERHSELLAQAVDGLQRELAELRRQIAELDAQRASDHERALLALRLVRDDDDRARKLLWQARASAGYERAFDDPEPLISIVITTYMNWPLLRDRCLPSVLAQTYENWEAIIVGDAAPDEARAVVESFGDERLRFVNLPYRGPYPDDPLDAWHISGTQPWNTGLSLAKGSWIAANSDDDGLRPTHFESLLRVAREQHAEVPYGCLAAHTPDREPETVGVFPPARGLWGMQTALMHGALRFLPLEPSDWVFGIPNDASLLERMLRIGVRFGFLDEPVVDYYPSRLWSEREHRLTRREQF